MVVNQEEFIISGQWWAMIDGPTVAPYIPWAGLGILNGETLEGEDDLYVGRVWPTREGAEKWLEKYGYLHLAPRVATVTIESGRLYSAEDDKS